MSLLLRRLAEPFLLISRGHTRQRRQKSTAPARASPRAFTSLRSSLWWPLLHTHTPQCPSHPEAAMSARRPVLAVGKGAVLLAGVTFQQLLLTFGIRAQQGPGGQFPGQRQSHWAPFQGLWWLWVGWRVCVGGLRVSDDAGGSRAASAGPRQRAALCPLGAPGGIGAWGLLPTEPPCTGSGCCCSWKA